MRNLARTERRARRITVPAGARLVAPWIVLNLLPSLLSVAAVPEAPAGVSLGLVVPWHPAERRTAEVPAADLVQLSILTPEDVCGLAATPALPTAARGGRRAFLLVEPGAEQETCWLAGLVELAGPRAGLGSTYLVGDGPDRHMEPAAFVFLLKRAAIALRAADATAAVMAGPLLGEDPEWLPACASLGAAPYMQGLAAAPAMLERILSARDRLFPGLPVWALDRQSGNASSVALLRVAALLRDGADVAVIGVRTPHETRSLGRFAAELPPGARTTHSTTVRAAVGDIEPVLELIGTGGVRLVMLAPHPGPVPLRIGLPPVDSADVFDPSTGVRDSLRVRHSGGESRVRAASSATPQLIRIRPTSDLSADRLEVERTRPGLTASEIIARERESRARQRLRLTHFQARARMAYHFTVSNLGESIEVMTENDAFGRGEAVEYRQTALFVNGHRWRGEPPSFPFVAPEKVTEIPLEVTLTEGYRYELKGETEENGRACYRIGFVPKSEGEGDFRGTVWIDREEFQRVRLDLVRLRPSHPVTSDALTKWFEPVETDAGTFWLVHRMQGQMVFSALAHNAVVERKVDLEEFRVNLPTFEPELQAARESSDPMFRDSLAEGLVKLLPEGDDGERSASSASTKSNTLLVAGWGGSFDGDLGGPFAAINWFDLDFRGTGTQLDVAWAGPFAAVSATWPPSKSGWETSLQTFLSAVPSKERYANAEGRVDGADLKRLDESIQVFFRKTLHAYVTFAIDARLAYLDVRRRGSTHKEYVLPPDTLVPGLGLRLDIQRNGFEFAFWGQADRRLDWGPFGLAGDEVSFTDVRDDPVRYGIQFNKNIYTRDMSRLSFDVDLWGGDNLDRFSSFSSRALRGLRIRGYSSAGIHFKDGITADFDYAFRTRGNLRFELTLGGAIFRNPDDFGEAWQHAYGASLGVTFPGPRGTLIRFRTNLGIDSSLPIEGSRGSARLTVFKTFNGWWPGNRRKRGRPQPPPEELPDQPFPNTSRILPTTSSGEGTMPPAVP